jgi:Na+-transporting NADH:ubiquinone oxidoreductase subunit D
VSCGLCGGKAKLTLAEGIWKNNPISIQIIGICSALAVTNRFENALVMGAALVLVTALSNLFVSLLRTVTPRRVRMIAEMAIIATFVIILDQFLKAFYWDMSKQLGPYVGLIITNCILMGRAEAFALQNPPLLSVVDGAANGLGYAAVLAIIGFTRELAGSGRIGLLEKLFGHTIDLSAWYEPNQLMVLAPGAFFALGFLIAIAAAVKPPNLQEKKP